MNNSIYWNTDCICVIPVIVYGSKGGRYASNPDLHHSQLEIKINVINKIKSKTNL